jgi:hypothetical protein
LRLFLQGQEMTWVVADHEAPAGSAEITVRKGQQVEVLEVPSGQDMCLVRLHAASAAEPPVEGMVPLAVLKPTPQGLKGQRAHEGKTLFNILRKSIIFSLLTPINKK